jgi:hypothetical protein
MDGKEAACDTASSYHHDFDSYLSYAFAFLLHSSVRFRNCLRMRFKPGRSDVKAIVNADSGARYFTRELTKVANSYTELYGGWTAHTLTFS